MGNRQIPPSEKEAYRNRQRGAGAAKAIAPFVDADPSASQFIRDLEAIALSLADQVQAKRRSPHDIPMLPPFERQPGAQRLPVVPLRRIARRIGMTELRYLFEVGSDNAMQPFRLLIRPRLDKEFSRGNRYKRHDHRTVRIEFGNRVLEIERGNVGRTEALERAGNDCGLQVSSTRSLERYFQEFRSICMKLGYVPHPLEAFGYPPAFALSDLDGRGSDTAQK